MATAVIRMVIDAEGVLLPGRYAAGLAQLEAVGLELVASPSEHLAERRREVEILADDLDPDGGRTVEQYADLCRAAFGLPAEPGVVTYISRGTDEDALGVLSRFGVVGEVERHDLADGEIVTVTIARAEGRRVPESRLRTALEAALNSEVRLCFV